MAHSSRNETQKESCSGSYYIKYNSNAKNRLTNNSQHIYFTTRYILLKFDTFDFHPTWLTNGRLDCVLGDYKFNIRIHIYSACELTSLLFTLGSTMRKMTFTPRLSRRSFVDTAAPLHNASLDVIIPTWFHLQHTFNPHNLHWKMLGWLLLFVSVFHPTFMIYEWRKLLKVLNFNGIKIMRTQKSYEYKNNKTLPKLCAYFFHISNHSISRVHLVFYSSNISFRIWFSQRSGGPICNMVDSLCAMCGQGQRDRQFQSAWT